MSGSFCGWSTRALRCRGRKIWLDAVTAEDDGSVIADLRLLSDALLEKGWREGVVDLCYREIEGAGHKRTPPGARFPMVLQQLLHRQQQQTACAKAPESQ